MPPTPSFSGAPENSDRPSSTTSSAEQASRAAALHSDSYPAMPTAPERSAANPAGPAASSATDQGKTQWTLAVDLAANQPGADGGGAVNQQQRLEALAERTRGTNVAIVAEVALPQQQDSTKTSKSADAAHFGKKDAVSSAAAVGNHLVERFMIRNGTVTKIGDPTASKGYSQDVTDLLQLANQQAPSQRLGLIIQSHGGASDGLEGDVGSSTLPAFTQAVTDGLKGSGHAKLDLLDFDACSMGNLNVVESMAPIADHMVASSEEESSGKHAEYDAQNLQATVTNLLSHPTMSASELADQMVTQANAGVNDAFNTEDHKMGSGTPTLAHFDLNNVSNFNSSLNALGTELTRASNTPAERAAINKAIDAAPRLPVQGIELAGHPNEDRDMKSFANRLMQSMNSGEINDPALKSALQNYLGAEKQLIPSYHGTAVGNYNTQGGLTAFLPDLQLRDTSNQDGAGNLPFGQIQYQAARDNDFSTMQHKGVTVNNINNEIDDTAKLLGTSHAAEITQLRSDAARAAAANNQAEFRSALDRLEDDSNKLAKSSFETDLVRAANAQNRDSVFKEQSVPLSGWQTFMESLRKGT